jgi:hypothetical protein
MESIDDWVTVLRSAAGELAADAVGLDEATAADPRDDRIAVLVTGRDGGAERLLRRVTGNEPDGTRWSATAPLDRAGADARKTAERKARRKDALVHVVPAEQSFDDSDRRFLVDQVIKVAHVTAIAVVVAGLERLEADEREPMMAYVRDAVTALGHSITVTDWPGDDLAAWWREAFPDVRPTRDRQLLEQLRDGAAEIESAATRAAEQARSEAPDEHLATAGELAGKALTAAEIRRELRCREEKLVAATNRQLDDLAGRLAADTARQIRAAEPDEVEAILDRFPQEADRAVETVQATFEQIVQADVAWFDEQMAALFEAMAASSRGTPGPRRTRARRPTPVHKQVWIWDKVAPLAGTVTRLGTRLLISLAGDKVGGDGKARRGKTALDVGGGEIATQAGQVVEAWVERWNRSRRANTAVDAARAATGLLVREADLADRAREFYDRLAAEFDTARQENTPPPHRTTPAEARALALADQARTVAAEIDRAIRGAVR